MAYASWSVVFGEQPSAAKWNILGTNDASFNDGTGIADDAIKSRHIDWADTGSGDEGGIWWEEIGRTTLSVAGDTISVQNLPVRKYLKILVYALATGGFLDTQLRLNNDSGTNYAGRLNVNGTFSSEVSQTEIALESGSTDSGQIGYTTAEIVNVAAQEKSFHLICISQDAAGGAATTTFIERYGKWANKTNAITRVDVMDTGASTGDFAIGSEVVVLGHN